MNARLERVSPPIADPSEILLRRLENQHLVGQRIGDPRQMVAHLGAVQSQDFPAALWALALRLESSTLEALYAAFNRGDILRTHVLRPTWHFVAPEDIRWMLALTGPRIRRAMTTGDRDLGMDPHWVRDGIDALARALEGGQALTRPELGRALVEAGIDWRNDLALLARLASAAELESVICSGPLKGAQHTYALLNERVAPARARERDEAVAELVCRYFTSHGPATLNDFAWWSGLTVGDARRGLSASGTRFTSQQVGGLTYWFDAHGAAGATRGADIWLLPNFDEFTVAYRSRDLFYPREIVYRPGPRYDAPFGNVIVVDGMVLGIWKRSVRKGQLSIEPEWFNPPTAEQQAACGEAIARYAAFMGQVLSS
jgi:hypothetical protein